ncbi:hypothetical protein FNV43_RR10447 [Rhamnella rubrinervis]|uniref:Uncharacterized protein n=1 Tax=Rhamnella rubrinervis TaxID=2594499 RepID=A0A8K0HBU2_9ROSA|nr:hypothetical protein FNV43_RR10447 [Rhamnella rubrinervis]
MLMIKRKSVAVGDLPSSQELGGDIGEVTPFPPVDAVRDDITVDMETRIDPNPKAIDVRTNSAIEIVDCSQGDARWCTSDYIYVALEKRRVVVVGLHHDIGDLSSNQIDAALFP